MTAPDPRVGEIEARANNPFSPDNPRAQMDADRDYLLAELRKAREENDRLAAVATRYRDEWRKAREALARVEAACDRVINNEDGHKPPGPPHPSQQQATALRIRAAVAAANGGGK